MTRLKKFKQFMKKYHNHMVPHEIISEFLEILQDVPRDVPNFNVIELLYVKNI